MTIELPPQTILTREQEIDLAKRIEAGVFARHLLCDAPDGAPGRPTAAELTAVADDGADAWREFFLANLRLVMVIAVRWARSYRQDVEDAFQEGCLGLAQAIQRWDHARGTRFSTLAWGQITWRVRKQCVERGGAAEAPAWWMDEQATLRRRHVELQAQLGRRTGSAELAASLGRPPSWVGHVLTWEPPRQMAVLPDVPVPLPDADPSARNRCLTGLARMPERERRVVVGHFGLSGRTQTYESLAQSLGCSLRHVKQLETRGLRRLRDLISADDEAELAWAA